MWTSGDTSTTAGGRQHVMKTSEADYRSKNFALTAKLAQCWTGPYKILLVDPGTTSKWWEKRLALTYYYGKNGDDNKERK